MFISRRHPFSEFARVALALSITASCADPPHAPMATMSPTATATPNVVIGPSGYAMQTLPHLAGATSSQAKAINDQGDVVGTMRFAAYGNRAVLWAANGAIVTLPTPAGGYTSCHAADINNAGWIVGVCYGDGGGGRPFLYTPFTGMLSLDAAPYETEANAVSDGGIVVGGSLDHTAWRWSWNDGYQVLPAPSGFSRALDVNASGYTVGSATPSSWIAAHAWNPNGSGTSLGSLPGGQTAVATGISSSNWIVGYAEYSSADNFYHAFVWTWYSGMQDLGALSINYSAEDVSAKGRIVGTIAPDSASGTSERAWTWKNGTFAYLFSPPSLGARAEAVNSCGTVVGSTRDPSTQLYRAARWIRRACDQ